MGVIKQPMRNEAKSKSTGIRVNGKQWHESQPAFRPTAGQRTYKERMVQEDVIKLAKLTAKDMKDDKDAKRQARAQAIRDRRKDKAEKEQYAKTLLKMNQRRADRKMRRQNRNKMTNS